MKKILFVASECVPFVKTGGLADVVGALPKYFDKEKYEVRVILPNYRFIPAKWKERMQFVTQFLYGYGMEKPVCGNHGDGICGDSLLFHRQ